MRGGGLMTYARVQKPRELTELHDLFESLFDVLGEFYDVPRPCPLPLHTVDDAESHDDPQLIAAVAMWDVRSLRHASAPNQPVLNADVVSLAGALHIAIDRLIGDPTAYQIADLLSESRNRVDNAARVAASLGIGHDGGIVELA
jgi:hypothetical protein